MASRKRRRRKIVRRFLLRLPSVSTPSRWFDATAQGHQDLDTILIDCARNRTSPPNPAERSSKNTLRKPPRSVTVASGLSASGPRYRGSNPCLPASLRSPAGETPPRRATAGRPASHLLPASTPTGAGCLAEARPESARPQEARAKADVPQGPEPAPETCSPLG